jgi:sugar phosphate isomerase/epimerase
MVYTQYNDSMTPKYSFPVSRIGSPTSPFTAKQLKEFGDRLNEGIKNVEIGALDQTNFETIPAEHFEEIRRLAKITGSNASLHAPMLDISGFHEQSWSEELRRQTEQQLVSIMERAHVMSDEKKGCIPIVIHGGNTFSQEYDKTLEKSVPLVKINPVTGAEENVKDSNGQIIYRPGIRKMAVVNPSSGRVSVVEYDTKYRPESAKPERYDPWRRIRAMNQTEWDEEKLKVFDKIKLKDELMERLNAKHVQNEDIKRAGLNTEDSPAYFRQYEQNNAVIQNLLNHIDEIDTKLKSEISDLHDKMKTNLPSNSDPNYGVYKKQADEYTAFVEKLSGDYKTDRAKCISNFYNAKSEEEKESALKNLEVIENGFNRNVFAALSKIRATPQLWKPVNEFAMEKAAETIANVMYTFHKNNPGVSMDKMPVLAIENFSPNTPISRGDELKAVVDDARKKFVEKLVESGESEKRAEEIASEHIGATWDVGHINLMRKAGYTEEEVKKYGIEQLKQVAKDVKHLHLTDNFGFHDSHLPPGMGNVPIKEVMEELEKRGFTGRAIIEAGAFVKEFEQSPTHHILEYFNSPIYAREGTPYWQPERHPGYKSNYIEFPQEHFNMYGSSFSTLPKIFGGQVGGDKSRFSDTPNA